MAKSRITNFDSVSSHNGLWCILPDRLRDMVSASMVTGIVYRQAEPAIPTIQTGIAIIQIHGVLSPRGYWWSDCSYDSIIAEAKRLTVDDNVSHIILDIDSPGGRASGCPEAAVAIMEAAAVKPVIAVANHEAASGAYWLGSQATEFVVSPSGRVGSIGAFVLHVDLSGANQEAGIKPTYVFSGEYKVEWNPDEPLSKQARAFAQGYVDEIHGEFIEAVAAGRGVSADVVRADFGQGRMLTADDALAAGMVDRIATLDEVIQGILDGDYNSGGMSARTNGEKTMATGKTIDGQVNKPGEFQAALNKALGLPEDAETTVAVKALADKLAAKPAAQATEPDPTRYVPLAAHQEVMKELADLRSRVVASGLKDFLVQGESEGKILASTKEWWTAVYMSNQDKAGELLKSSPVIAPRTGSTDAVRAAGSAPASQRNSGRTATIAQAKREYEGSSQAIACSLSQYVNQCLTEANLPRLSKDESSKMEDAATAAA